MKPTAILFWSEKIENITMEFYNIRDKKLNTFMKS